MVLLKKKLEYILNSQVLLEKTGIHFEFTSNLKESCRLGCVSLSNTFLKRSLFLKDLPKQPVFVWLLYSRLQHRFQNIICRAGQASPDINLPCWNLHLPCHYVKQRLVTLRGLCPKHYLQSGIS